MRLLRNKFSEKVHLLTPDGRMYCNVWNSPYHSETWDYDGTEITCKKCKKGLRTYLAIVKFNIKSPYLIPPVELIRYLAPYLVHKRLIDIKGGF